MLGLRQVQQVCVLIRERSARLIAATLAGILRHLHRDRCMLGLCSCSPAGCDCQRGHVHALAAACPG